MYVCIISRQATTTSRSGSSSSSVSCTACPCSSQGSLWEMCNFNSTDFVLPFLGCLAGISPDCILWGVFQEIPEEGRKEGRKEDIWEGRGGEGATILFLEARATQHGCETCATLALQGTKLTSNISRNYIVTMIYSPNSGNSRPTLNMIK